MSLTLVADTVGIATSNEQVSQRNGWDAAFICSHDAGSETFR